MIVNACILIEFIGKIKYKKINHNCSIEKYGVLTRIRNMIQRDAGVEF